MWIGPVFFDVERRELRSEAGVTRLTHTDEAVLRTLLKATQPVHRERLVHGAGNNSAVAIWRLRRKLAPHGLRIETQWGVGWRLVVPGTPERCPVCGTVIRRDP